MIRVAGGLLIAVIGDSQVEIGRLTNALISANVGAEKLISCATATQVTLEVSAPKLADIVCNIKEMEPRLPYGFDHGRRRGKGERKRNRADRWK